MFPRDKRVSRDAFPKLLSSRTRTFSTHFSATLAQSPRGVAVVVAKSVEKTSVGRHRLKRRVSEVIRSCGEGIAPGVIIFAKKGAAALTFTELRTEVRSLLL